jgi:DNA integrity scanning protein DisA with diadenylate cyclase activity/mannitol/fructose-specific phosphotransferase system IIA component (Ntr-type)
LAFICTSGRRPLIRENGRVELNALVDSIHVVELTSRSRIAAIRELVSAGGWDASEVPVDQVVAAIEDREAAAQTVIAPGLAFPHAVIAAGRGCRLVLGRSRAGVQYGVPAEEVRLVLLLLVGKDVEDQHLQMLAAIAQLLSDASFRDELVAADDVRRIRQLLIDRAGRQAKDRARRAEVPNRNIALIRHAMQLVDALAAQALLLAVDRCEQLPWQLLEPWKGRLLIVTGEGDDEVLCDRDDTHLFGIPHASLSRMDRAKLGLLLAAANGLLKDQSDVVCVAGKRGQPLDCISVTAPAAHLRAVLPEADPRSGTRLAPAVVLRVLSLAIELAAEGRESAAVGAMFVIGDARRVMRRTQQLVLNPFKGFSRRLRNVLDPSLAETIKEFALLDGSFVIDADGTVLSAGTYLVSQSPVKDLVGGLGARHQAAAAITAETRAVAVTLSQSTGTVTLFQRGGIALTLERATATRW